MSNSSLVFLNNRLNIRQNFLERHCVLCGIASKTSLCPACLNSLPRLPSPHCRICALPVTGSDVCGACIADPPEFDGTAAALSYAFPADALIHSLKYQGNLAMASVLAELFHTLVGAIALPDFIVPMPLHPVRLRERGFNQAMEIARSVSRQCGVALLPEACKRVKDMPSQAGLPWKEREKNIRNAFICEANLAGKRIAILDDVMTTGATLNELAKAIRQRGASEITGWIIARTLHQ
ncbi:MAG: ComF family protein [Nitrosospira sp.]|nr:ComF family protein [Nitrosospira sp.]